MHINIRKIMKLMVIGVQAGGRGGLQPPNPVAEIFNFGQNADDSGESTREKTL